MDNNKILKVLDNELGEVSQDSVGRAIEAIFALAQLGGLYCQPADASTFKQSVLAGFDKVQDQRAHAQADTGGRWFIRAYTGKRVVSTFEADCSGEVCKMRSPESGAMSDCPAFLSDFIYRYTQNNNAPIKLVSTWGEPMETARYSGDCGTYWSSVFEMRGFPNSLVAFQEFSEALNDRCYPIVQVFVPYQKLPVMVYGAEAVWSNIFVPLGCPLVHSKEYQELRTENGERDGFLKEHSPSLHFNLGWDISRFVMTVTGQTRSRKRQRISVSGV